MRHRQKDTRTAEEHTNRQTGRDRQRQAEVDSDVRAKLVSAIL